MNTLERWQRGLVPALGGLLVGLALGVNWPLTAQVPVREQEAAPPKAPAAFRAEAPAARGLDATLYVQTAAEYRACCYQAYNLATRRLAELQAEAKGDGKPLVVVMDLDERVLDNAGLFAMLQRSGLGYDQRLWDMWEGQYADSIGLVPGAKEFIDDAGKRGVTVVYLSNRNVKYRDSTESALKRLGIPARKREHLKLSTGPGDKTGRRQEVEKEFRVLLYLGGQPAGLRRDVPQRGGQHQPGDADHRPGKAGRRHPGAEGKG
jgi:5'-nucleotidase (lipoprotein e(P4) family)